MHRTSLTAYIGSSGDIPSRWSGHRQLLAEGRHPNQGLSEAWGNDGADGFEFRILEPIDERSTLIEREQAWIDWWKSNGFRLFNRAPNAKSTIGIEHTDEVRAQMRANPKRKFRGKLSIDAVREIKHRAKGGEDFDALSVEFDIHRHTVYMIATDRMWPDVG